MKYAELLPSWAKPVFKEAGLELSFSEQKMNCSACSFAQGDLRDGSTKLEKFAEKLKCCTFFPNLANFAAGFELSKNPSIFDKVIDDPALALPLGIIAPKSYKEKYAAAEFGTREDLLCPHFDRAAQNCRIWTSRPSSCVRFVCKSSLESVGQMIWEQTESALGALEMNLAYEAALQLGLVNYEIATDRWNISIEEKRKFYIAAATYVDSLSASQKIDLAGEQFAKAGAHLQSLVSDVAPRAAL